MGRNNGRKNSLPLAGEWKPKRERINMIIHVKFISVLGRELDNEGDAQIKTMLQNALYDHTCIVQYDESIDKRAFPYVIRFAAILRTEGDTDEQASFSSNYQTKRLHSFGTWGAKTHDNPKNARKWLNENMMV